jgi:hypothetical protein
MKRRQLIRNVASASLITVIGASTAAARATERSDGGAGASEHDGECCGDKCLVCDDSDCPCCKC